MQMQMRALLIAVGLIGSRELSAQQITPKFAWPVGAHAEIESTVKVNVAASVSLNSASSNIADSVGMRMAGVLDVSRHSSGLRVVMQQRMVGREGGGETFSQLNFGAAASNSDVIVRADGQFVALGDPAGMKARADSTLAPQLEKLRTMAPSMAKNLEASTSLEALTQNARVGWRSLVGVVTERSWSPGDSSVEMVSTPFPIRPGATLSLPQQIRYDGVVPCPAPQKGTCWQFTQSLVVSRATMLEPMRAMFKEMGLPESSIEQVPVPESTTTTITVYDAATLRPLRSEMKVSAGGSGTMITSSSTLGGVTFYRWK